MFRNAKIHSNFIKNNNEKKKLKIFFSEIKKIFGNN